MSPLYPVSPCLRSFGAASVILCCSTPPVYTSTPLRPFVRSPNIDLVANKVYVCTFCDPCKCPSYFDETCIALKSGLSCTSTTARTPISSLIVPCPRLIPCHHSQADGRPSPVCRPSLSFSSFGAACVKLCGLPPPSLDKTTVAAVSSNLQRPKYKARFKVKVKLYAAIRFSDTVDELIPTFKD